jgi:hypothetical protein
MKRLMILFAATLSMAACTSKPDKSGAETSDTTVAATTDVATTEPVSQTVCFQKLDGTANQDTTRLKLNIDGSNVSGEFGSYPKEKDRRVGKITATKDGELIKGVWVYMQEGMNDTLQVEFKLDGDKLVQKSYSVDSKTGREVITSASVFDREFMKVDCLR